MARYAKNLEDRVSAQRNREERFVYEWCFAHLEATNEIVEDVKCRGAGQK